MGFLDKLKETVGGAVDLLKAPLALPFDLIRAFPGPLDLGQPFGRSSLELGVQGVSQIAGAIGPGLDAALGPIDEGLGRAFNEMELLYNHEFQRERGQAGAVLGAFGAEPGQVSVARGLATATGAAGTALPGGTPFNQVTEAWRRSANSSPGQAFIDSSIGLYNLSQEQQDSVRARPWYNVITGTIDAAARWYTQPEILVGRGIGAARSRFNPTVDDLIRRANARGLNFQAVSDAPGSRLVRTDQPLHTVVRMSQLENVQSGGSAALFGADELDDLRSYAQQLARQNPDDPVGILTLNTGDAPILLDDFSPMNASNNRGGVGISTTWDNLAEDGASNIELVSADEVFEPPAQLHERLFNADGSPKNPEALADFNDLREVHEQAFRTFNQDGETAAVKFLKAANAQRAGTVQSASGVEHILNHRSVQQVLNWMDGKSPDEIRRRLFSEHSHGALLSRWFSEASTYAERRAIMGASMGLDVNPGVLEPVLEMRIRSHINEMDRVMRGDFRSAVNDIELGMMSDSTSYTLDQMNELAFRHQDEITRLQRQQDLVRFLEDVKPIAPIRNVPRLTAGGAMREFIRSSQWYQTSRDPARRALRSVTEMKPHQFMNINASDADIQIVRQLEEAQAFLKIGGDEVSAFRNRFIAAETLPQKLRIVAEMEDFIVRRAGAQSGLEKAEVEQILNASARGRRITNEFLRSRRYAPDRDMDIVRWLDEDTGELVEMAMPVLGSQLQNWITLTDVRELRRVTNSVTRWRSKFPGTQIPREIMDSFYQVWKPTVLLRGGWPIRVVSDEQLRILSRTGSMVQHLAAIEAGEKIAFSGVLDPGIRGGQRAAAVYGLPASVGTAVAQRAASRVAQVTNKLFRRRIDPQYLEDLRAAGTEPLVSARASFAGPTDSVFQEFQSMLGIREANLMDHLYSRGTGQWQAVTRDSRNYGQAWQRVLNRQLGQDDLARRIMTEILVGLDNGKRLDDVIEEASARARGWLSSRAGREYADRLPWRRNDHDRWVNDIVGMIGEYTSGFNPRVMRPAISSKVNATILESIDEGLRPASVHAEIVEQTLGRSETTTFLKDFLSQSFDLFGRLPTDTMSRQPFFRQVYANEMRRLRLLAKERGEDLTEETLQNMSLSARRTAVDETKELLYDLAETSRFGQMARFFSPFFNAWQEVLTVWTGEAIRNPQRLGQGRLLWKAPERAGLVETDDEGNQFMSFRLSESQADRFGLEGWQRYLATGGVRVGLTSFNLILSNPFPSVGPAVAVPVNEIVLRRPELEEMLGFILPFGATADRTDLVLSPIMRSVISEFTGPRGDDTYQRNYANAVSWCDVNYRAGNRSLPCTPEEAHEVARKIQTLQFFSRVLSPAQPIWDSPLRPYAEAYRDLIELHGNELGVEVFMNEFGSEFLAVTTSRTVSATGIPPTVEGQRVREQYETLITEYPEYGRLIVGDEATGEFSTAAFAAQILNPVDPNDPFADPERTYRLPEIDPRTGRDMDIDRRNGWDEYTRYMDLIELERKNRGLPSLRVNGAEDLAQIKRAVTQAIAEKYPSWWDDFNTRNDLKWGDRIKAFRTIANSDLMEDRPEWQAVGQYIDFRDLFLGELNRRKQLGGSSTLSAQSNADLQVAWETLVFKLLENPAFAPLYFRYLEGDPVELSR